MASASVVCVSSLSLLIRRHKRARCQAEIPLIAPSEIVEPLLIYADFIQPKQDNSPATGTENE
jgi:hypothetical protein